MSTNDVTRLTIGVLLLFTAPAIAASVDVEVVAGGPNPQALAGAAVSLGADGIATFNDVPEGEQVMVVTGENIRHRPAMVQVTEGATIQARVRPATAMQSPGVIQIGLTGFRWEPDDWTADGTALGMRFRFAEVGGNGPWAAFYIIPTYGSVNIETSFLPESGAAGCDCIYSGDGNLWSVGFETVFKPGADKRLFFSLRVDHSETDTVSVGRDPEPAGLISSAYSMELKRDSATFLVGLDRDIVAPYAGIKRIAGDTRLRGEYTLDAPIVDPAAPPGTTIAVDFDNRFDDDATLGVAGARVRIPGSRVYALFQWSGDGDNSQVDIQAYYGFGGS